MFFVMQVLEWAIAWYRGKMTPRFNDTFSSVTAGMLSRVPRYDFERFDGRTY